jgi:thiol-disulfide isomerase/thioredoxin
MQAGTSKQITQEIGGTVDDFGLQNVHGGEQSLSGLLAGKKGAVVLFWSGVCSHCVRYDGYLNGFSQRHPELAFVAIASRQGETPEQIRKTMDERSLLFPILFDPGSQLAERWFTQQTPRVFLLDGQRSLLYRGAIDNYKYPTDPEYVAYLEPAIDDFIAGRPVARAETASFGCAIRSVYYILPKNL